MLLVECLRNIRYIRLRSLGFGETLLSPQKTSRRIDIRQKTLKACRCTNCACVCVLEKANLRKRREARASASARMERKGNMHDEICSCVGWLWALAAWCCGIVSPPPSHQVSKSCMFPRPFSPLLSCCHSRMYASLVLSCRRPCGW